MVKVTEINLRQITGSTIYIDIDIFRFVKDIGLFNVVVQMDNQGEFEYLDEIAVTDSNGIVKDHNDLVRIALNWIFKNVEVVKEV